MNGFGPIESRYRKTDIAHKSFSRNYHHQISNKLPAGCRIITARLSVSYQQSCDQIAPNCHRTVISLPPDCQQVSPILPPKIAIEKLSQTNYVLSKNCHLVWWKFDSNPPAKTYIYAKFNRIWDLVRVYDVVTTWIPQPLNWNQWDAPKPYGQPPNRRFGSHFLDHRPIYCQAATQDTIKRIL